MTWKKATKDYTAKVLATASANLVGYWPLDDAIGSSTARNLKVGANTVGGVNGTGYAYATGGMDGPIRNYLTVSGSQAQTQATIASWNGVTGTLMCWLKPSATTGYNWFASVVDGSNYITIGTNSGSAVSVNVSQATSINNTMAMSPATGSWTHVAVNVTATALTLYVNGVKNTPTVRAVAWAGSATTVNVSLGGSVPAGAIAHCAIWTGINLTDDQILQLSRMNG